MKFKRIWVLFMARNYEFIRDRAGFGWNILFPFLIVAGFGLLFSTDTRMTFKAGVFPVSQQRAEQTDTLVPPAFSALSFVDLVSFEDKKTGLEKLSHHKIDILIEADTEKTRYWTNASSVKGQVIEKALKASLVPDDQMAALVERGAVDREQVRYIDWLFPGILGMNIMFSALFGVGYVVVRYRRNGVLKRLKATPVTAFDYLTAQLASRVTVLIFSTILVWAGCEVLFSFQVQGSYLDVFLVFLTGTVSLVCLGLVMACRGTNEELTNGVINFICWPMMFLSEVWFSIEGAAPWVKQTADLLPLTHFLRAARRVINEGATLSQVSHELSVMLLMGLVFLVAGSALFSWTR